MAGLSIIALLACLGVAAQAQPAAPGEQGPPPLPPATGQSPQAPAVTVPADEATQTFRRSVSGSSLMVGMSRTYPIITIIDKEDKSTAPTIEQYRGDERPGYTVSWHMGLIDEPLFSDKIAGGFYSGWAVRLVAEIDTFSGRQALRRRPGGGTARGEITGEIAWGGMEALWLLAWENSVLPMAWSASFNLGVAAAQYSGELEFISSGKLYKGTTASRDIATQIVTPIELRWHLGPVVLRHILYESQFGTSDDGARVEYRGQSLANAAYQANLEITTLGYVFTF